MFTGLIEEVGSILDLQRTEQGTRLRLKAPHLAPKIQIGDSISVNGCCLTVANLHADNIAFDLLEKTLDHTNIPSLPKASRVNLERALGADGRLGGHFVQGHVDCSARIVAWEQRGPDHRLEIELPARFAHYVADKGSIAVNGISLTVAELTEESFVTWIVPHTRSQTNLDVARAGDRVNLEFDLLAKYLERMFQRHVVTS